MAVGAVLESASGKTSGSAIRVLGVLALAGAALAAITVLLPPKATGSDALVLAAGGVSGVAGVALLTVWRRVPEPVLWVLVLGGTALITLATREGGSTGTGTADNEVLYVWVCLYSFYFLSPVGAAIEVLGVGAAYAWLLAWEGPPVDEAVTRWMVTLGTLLVAGLLVGKMRRSLDRLVGGLTAMARIDSLTGVLNRRALEERAGIEFARLARQGGSLAMVVLDIDGFKTLNDGHGHPAGDRVLSRIADVLQDETRPADIVARLGGDEFAVLLPGASATAAGQIGERLRLAIRRCGSEAELPITVSVGTAVAPLQGDDLEKLWLVADRAMYEAKRAGGDRVATASAGRDGRLPVAVPTAATLA
jgi:diguanylate cyclase (GGDEF)-like protein